MSCSATDSCYGFVDSQGEGLARRSSATQLCFDHEKQKTWQVPEGNLVIFVCTAAAVQGFLLIGEVSYFCSGDTMRVVSFHFWGAKMNFRKFQPFSQLVKKVN